MKFNYFNFFVIFLFVFIILSSTTLSCTNFSPHYADSIFKKEGKFEGFQDKSKILGYTKKDDHSALNNYNMHLIKEETNDCGKAVEKWIGKGSGTVSNLSRASSLDAMPASDLSSSSSSSLPLCFL